MDESGFIVLKVLRRVGHIAAPERGTMVKMALSFSATGNSIPPFFLFPRKRKETSFLDSVFQWIWVNMPVEFVRCIRYFIENVKPSVDSPVLLLLDNHASHLSVETIDMAIAHGVHILAFPPHCSHKLQPLEVSVFGPLKCFSKTECSSWQKANANKVKIFVSPCCLKSYFSLILSVQVLKIHHIAGLVCNSLDQTLTAKKIKSGFKATGICPFDAYIFLDSDFVQAVEQNLTEIETEYGLDEDKQRRII